MAQNCDCIKYRFKKMGRRDSREKERSARVIGVAATLLFHILLLSVCIKTGVRAHYTPPREIGLLLDFTQEEISPIEVEAGNVPKAENARVENEVQLAQRSEAQTVSEEPAIGKETTMEGEGDIETFEPKRTEIDTRALFSSANNRSDTLAAQTAERVSDALKAGVPQGNTRFGDINNAPMANVRGRNVVGSLPIPDYTVNKEGRVVVRILVDQYGKVTNAVPGANGTTVQDKELWDAAEKAAYKALFNVSSSAPAVQEGTITYIFKLK